MEKLKESLKTITIVVLILLLLFGYTFLKRFNKAEIAKLNLNYSAMLADTLKKITSKTDTLWLTQVTELTPEEVINSIIYGELKYEQQLLLAELAKYKNLVASNQVNVSGGKTDTITQIIRVPCYSPFRLTWQDTFGGFTYTDTVYIDSPVVKRAFYPKLQFTPDIRITKTKKGYEGEWRFTGLEEFDLTVVNGYSFYKPLTAEEQRKKKMMRALKISGMLVKDVLIFYGGTKLGQAIE